MCIHDWNAVKAGMCFFRPCLRRWWLYFFLQHFCIFLQLMCIFSNPPLHFYPTFPILSCSESVLYSTHMYILSGCTNFGTNWPIPAHPLHPPHQARQAPTRPSLLPLPPGPTLPAAPPTRLVGPLPPAAMVYWQLDLDSDSHWLGVPALSVSWVWLAESGSCLDQLVMTTPQCTRLGNLKNGRPVQGQKFSSSAGGPSKEAKESHLEP